MWVPGFGTEDIRSSHRRSAMSESHKSRMALIRKTLKKYWDLRKVGASFDFCRKSLSWTFCTWPLNLKYNMYVLLCCWVDVHHWVLTSKSFTNVVFLTQLGNNGDLSELSVVTISEVRRFQVLLSVWNDGILKIYSSVYRGLSCLSSVQPSPVAKHKHSLSQEQEEISLEVLQFKVD